MVMQPSMLPTLQFTVADIGDTSGDRILLQLRQQQFLVSAALFDRRRVFDLLCMDALVGNNKQKPWPEFVHWFIVSFSALQYMCKRLRSCCLMSSQGRCIECRPLGCSVSSCQAGF